MTPESPAASDTRCLPVGKLPPEILKRQLLRMAAPGGRIRIGPRLGDDASAIETGDRYLVCASDPVTLASDRIGYYAVHVNANDVAVLGARPAWFWATILFPEGRCDAALVDRIFSDIRNTCAEIGVTLCGGHSEVTAGLCRPIACGFMAGEAGREKLVDKRRIAPGDDIVLVRGIAVEGTATIAAERPDLLASVDRETVDRARLLLDDPGISIVAEAMLAVESAEVHGMHDPTEGGLRGALRELAEAAGIGLSVDASHVIVLPETEAVCGALGIDPMGLLASGALLVAVPPDCTPRLIAAYEEKGIPARVIARAENKGFGLKISHGGGLVPLPVIERDEITKILS